MKILHIVPSYFPAYRHGGPILSVHSLNKWLVKLGIDVTVYATNTNGGGKLDVSLCREMNVDGVKVFYFPFSSLPILCSWYYSRELANALRKNMEHFDLVHITSVFLSASTVGAYYAKKYKKPFIISPRGSLMKEPLEMKNAFLKKFYLSIIEKNNLKNASAIHFTAEKEKDEYIKAGLPLKKAIIIPNCLNPQEFQSFDRFRIDFRRKWGISEDKKIILFLSRLNWKKGLDTLIPAFAEVLKKEPDAVLVLAGPDDENYKKEIELEIRNWKLEINNNVIFTGMLVGDDKIAAYRESDVFILPSYSENFGMAVVEAMYFGLPVVVTKNVGISPSVEKAGAGLVVTKDVNQVAEAVLKILNNPDLAQKMGESGGKLVEREFSPEKVAERFKEEYTKLIDKFD